jgi:hypothetical protein
MVLREETEAHGENPVIDTLFTTNPAWAWLGRTQVFTVDKSPANRLSLHKDKKSPSLYIQR